LVNENGVSIHHVVDLMRFCPVAFILSERGARMVNRWCAAIGARFTTVPGVNPALNRLCVKRDE
jgi:hypothetical protein